MTLQGFRGHGTVILFWNRNYDFCQQLLPELRAWEANPPVAAPRLVVVAPGSVDEMKSMNLRSPVFVDRDSVASAAFGAPGKAMAMLVDAQGNVASAPASGADEVPVLLHFRSIADVVST